MLIYKHLKNNRYNICYGPSWTWNFPILGRPTRVKKLSRCCCCAALRGSLVSGSMKYWTTYWGRRQGYSAPVCLLSSEQQVVEHESGLPRRCVDCFILREWYKDGSTPPWTTSGSLTMRELQTCSYNSFNYINDHL